MARDPLIDEAGAARLVSGRLAELGIPEGRRPSSIERVWLEWTPPGAERGATVDRLAWLVTVSDAQGYAIVAIDDRDGEVLEVRRFR